MPITQKIPGKPYQKYVIQHNKIKKIAIRGIFTDSIVVSVILCREYLTSLLVTME